jgi:hypothetical protein
VQCLYYYAILWSQAEPHNKGTQRVYFSCRFVVLLGVWMFGLRMKDKMNTLRGLPDCATGTGFYLSVLQNANDNELPNFAAHYFV